MIPDKEYHKLFRSRLVDEREIEGAKYLLFENRIFYVRFPKYEKIDLRFAQHGYKFLDNHGGGQFYNIFHFDAFNDITEEIREWAASPNENAYTHCDALVLGNLGHKIIADFYIRNNKPIRPTRIFFSVEKALEWIFEQMAESSTP